MPTLLFPDTTVLINFAVIDELKLLRAYLGSRGRAVEAVAFEIGRSAERTPNLATVDIADWFGKPVRISKAKDVRAVSLIRTARFGGSSAEPLKHLGESQTIHAVSSFPEFKDSIVITDDRSAFDYSKRIGLVTRCTKDILQEVIAQGEMDALAAMGLVTRMLDRERTLLNCPLTHRDFH